MSRIGRRQDSIQKVTGPSFVSVTFMSAPNRPVATSATVALQTSTNLSKYSAAFSGGAALVKLARVPFLVSAARVNWGTSSRAAASYAAIHTALGVREYAVAQQALCTLAISY